MPPKIPRVQIHQPTKTFERSGGQSTFISPLSGVRNFGQGTYLINPVEASYGREHPLAILRQHMQELSDMARRAELLGEEEAKRRYGMLESALEDATLASNSVAPNEEMRLLMQVNSNGRPVGAASFQKGDVYGLSNKDLMDLDFTAPEPGTLHSLGVLGQLEGGKGFKRGEEYIRQVQDMLGNDNVFFETINKPEFSNLEYYYNLGARPTGKVRVGGNPFYEFKRRAQREPQKPDAKQMRLPGFAGGGLAKFGRGWFMNKNNKTVKELLPADLGPHGDHDGWISIAKNARALGVDPRDAKAMQRGSYGFFLPRKMSEEWVASGGSPMITNGRAFYSPMLGDSYQPAEDLFYELYGTYPYEAGAGGVLGAGSSLDQLLRARLWPNKVFSTDSVTGVLPDDLRNLWDQIGPTIETPEKLRFNVVGDSGKLIDIPLMEALTRKRFRRGGLIQLKECRYGR